MLHTVLRIMKSVSFLFLSLSLVVGSVGWWWWCKFEWIHSGERSSVLCRRWSRDGAPTGPRCAWSQGNCGTAEVRHGLHTEIPPSPTISHMVPPQVHSVTILSLHTWPSAHLAVLICDATSFARWIRIELGCRLLPSVCVCVYYVTE